jgi:hyperosmotically inducible protein
MRSLNLLTAPAGLALLATCLLVQAGCTSPTTDQAAETTPLSDSELQTRIEASLDTDAALRSADLDVDADAEENRATISGSTPTEALRTRAVELARSAHPGITLEVKVDVEPPDVSREEWNEEYSQAAATRAKESGDTVSNSLDDTWIHTKIVSKLASDADVESRRINVDVEKKVVTLRGTVPSEAEKTEAARIARETSGVVRVVNQLKVDADL